MNSSLGNWHPYVLRLATTDKMRRWLVVRGSLTEEILKCCTNISIRVIAQGVSRPHTDESRLLGLRRGEWAWLREVGIYADGEQVVYARSLLHQKNIEGAWRLVTALGNRSLGTALFADPRIRRTNLQVKKIGSQDRRYKRVRQIITTETGTEVPLPDALWARRSLFTRCGEPLLVCEVFLPSMTGLRMLPQ